jgi:hypothetical protein
LKIIWKEMPGYDWWRFTQGTARSEREGQYRKTLRHKHLCFLHLPVATELVTAASKPISERVVADAGVKALTFFS